MKARMEFAAAARSFEGFLRGTKKAELTLSSYRTDLESFRKFLEEGRGALPLLRVRLSDLERYAEALRAQGLRANTRRRKLLTVRRFLRYLSRRGRFRDDPSRALAAPDRVERVPETAPFSFSLKRIRSLPHADPLAARDRLLLWTLLEGGLSVHELVGLDWSSAAGGASLRIEGKRPRQVPMSDAWEAAWREAESLFRARYPKRPPRTPFCGFNRGGPLSARMTPRGAELAVRAYRGKLAVPLLTPRLLRHSAIAHWAAEGAGAAEIQKRLGLRTAYSLRVVPALWKKNKENAR